jgi:hypothetical protein
MNSHDEVEKMLERLGSAWPPGDSVVEGVLRAIRSDPPRRASQPVKSRRIKRVLALAAGIAAVIVLGWLVWPDRSLYGQARAAVHKARTFQMIVTVPADGKKPEQRFMALWYERGVGFREEHPSEIAIGNAKKSWRYLKDAKLAFESCGNSIPDLVDHVLDSEVGNALKNAKYERYAAGDQLVDGQTCQAYLMTKVEPQIDVELKAGKRRMVLLLDDRSRIVRIKTEMRSGDRWIARVISDWRYDVPIDRALFEPRFGADVRVVDADAAFDRFVDLDKAVHREEQRGLWYAIHQVKRFEGGGIFVVSSVRGTDATLRKYPLKRRNLGRFGVAVDGPATNIRRSFNPADRTNLDPLNPADGLPGWGIELASVDHQGINVKWWVLVPLPNPPPGVKPFDAGEGKVKIRVGINSWNNAYGKDYGFEDADGVMHDLIWDIELAVPEPKSLPTLEAITRQVYADVRALDAVPFKYLNMGNRDSHGGLPSDLNKITAADFTAAAADDVRWYQEGCSMEDPRAIEVRKGPVPSK